MKLLSFVFVFIMTISSAYAEGEGNNGNNGNGNNGNNGHIHNNTINGSIDLNSNRNTNTLTNTNTNTLTNTLTNTNTSTNTNTNSLSNAQHQSQHQTQSAAATSSANNSGNNQNVTINNTGGGSSSSSSSGGNGSGSGSGNGTVNLKTVPPVNAPALSTTLTETCMGSSSGGLSLMGFGLSGGSTWKDEECIRRLNARELAVTLKDLDAAKELLCGNPEIHAVYQSLGRPCLMEPSDSTVITGGALPTYREPKYDAKTVSYYKNNPKGPITPKDNSKGVLSVEYVAADLELKKAAAAEAREYMRRNGY